MSTSYPFLTISRQFGVPYGEVLEKAVYWFQHNSLARVWMIRNPINDAVLAAVVAEETRRRAICFPMMNHC